MTHVQHALRLLELERCQLEDNIWANSLTLFHIEQAILHLELAEEALGHLERLERQRRSRSPNPRVRPHTA